MLHSRSLQVLLAFATLVPFVAATSPVVDAPPSLITPGPSPAEVFPRQAGFTPLASKGPFVYPGGIVRLESVHCSDDVY